MVRRLTVTVNTLEKSDRLFVLGETLRPLLVVRVAAGHDIEFVR